MKRYFISNIIKGCALLFLITIGCTVDDGDETDVKMAPRVGTANVAVINALTDLEADDINTVDIYLDEKKELVEAEFGTFSDGYIEHRFPQGSMFRAINGGEAPVFLSASTSAPYYNILAVGTAASLLPQDHNVPLQGQLKDGGNYTLTLIGNYHNLGEVYFEFTEDNLAAPSAGNSKIRFINATTDSWWFFYGDVDFVVNGNVLATASFPHSEYSLYPTVTDFIETDLTSLSIEVWAKVYNTENEEEIEEIDSELLFEGTVEISAGGIYTIVLMGDSISEAEGEATQFKVFRNL